MYFVACCMSSQSDRNNFKTILIIVKLREVWKKERKTCSVQSDKTPRTNTRHCVVFCESAGKNPASQNSSFCKEWCFSDVNHMLTLKLQPNHHPLTEGTCFLWQPLKLLCWESILFDQSSPFPSLFTHHFDTAHPNTGSTGGKRGRKKLIV